MAEDCMHIYFGSTSLHTHLYLGESSVSFAKWMYDKLDIPIQIEKTDIRVTMDEYTYLHNINATMFAADDDGVLHNIKVLLDAYGVMRKNKLRVPDPQHKSYYMKESFIMEDVVNVFYNHTKKMTIVVPGSIELDGSESLLTLTRDLQWLDQIRLYPANKDKFVAALCDAFDKQPCNDFADARKRMATFKINVPR